ncbi:putative oxalocrotonate tautomerase [Aspergillus bertholletiae]|uniref:Putative oxalocrotonate tautomerase n=1 Tax=Aspergillus bertholletiae TaxID=1226010 RepID=A0A5N7ARI9_9EURO|nr:putative oxalocrotonate tautomerase [Aspergillus bertholletiae]
MPRWIIHHSANLLSAEEKQNLAKTITQIYSRLGLPDFYVHVHFQEQPLTASFIGGEPHSKFVDISVWHLARTMDTQEMKQRFLNAVDAVLNPVFEPKGIDWEYFVTESPKDLWKINGLVPPEIGSEEEKEWKRLNRAVKI